LQTVSGSNFLSYYGTSVTDPPGITLTFGSPIITFNLSNAFYGSGLGKTTLRLCADEYAKANGKTWRNISTWKIIEKIN
jgi:hypothetical protein